MEEKGVAEEEDDKMKREKIEEDLKGAGGRECGERRRRRMQ